MRKILLSFISILVLLILQVCVFPHFSLGGIIPNLLLILVSCYGFLRGCNDGMIAGFICGLLLDVFSMNFLGFFAFAYMFIGYFNGFLKDFNIKEILFLPILFIAVSDLVLNLFSYLFLMCMLNKHFNIDYYFIRVIVPELIFTSIIALGLYPLVNLLDEKFLNITATEEKDSAV